MPVPVLDLTRAIALRWEGSAMAALTCATRAEALRRGDRLSVEDACLIADLGAGFLASTQRVGVAATGRDVVRAQPHAATPGALPGVRLPFDAARVVGGSVLRSSGVLGTSARRVDVRAERALDSMGAVPSTGAPIYVAEDAFLAMRPADRPVAYRIARAPSGALSRHAVSDATAAALGTTALALTLGAAPSAVVLGAPVRVVPPAATPGDFWAGCITTLSGADVTVTLDAPAPEPVPGGGAAWALDVLTPAFTALPMALAPALASFVALVAATTESEGVAETTLLQQAFVREIERGLLDGVQVPTSFRP